MPYTLSDGTVYWMAYEEEWVTQFADLPEQHRPYSDGTAVRCNHCAMHVSWNLPTPPPKFGESGMGTWTDTIAPDW
ncbi:MAG: hypothetical protein ABW360_03960 [Phenylobacterium sp.]